MKFLFSCYIMLNPPEISWNFLRKTMLRITRFVTLRVAKTYFLQVEEELPTVVIRTQSNITSLELCYSCAQAVES